MCRDAAASDTHGFKEKTWGYVILTYNLLTIMEFELVSDFK